MIITAHKEFSDLLEKVTLLKGAAYKACMSISEHRYDLLSTDYKSIQMAYKVLKESMDILDRKISLEKSKI
jgi:hypothetical protein